MKFVTLFISLFFFVSCKNEKVEIQKNSFVVLCFDNYSPRPYTTPGGAFRPIDVGVTYISVFNEELQYFPNNLKDTLKIDCENDFVECLISYRNFEPVYFSLFKGDTVHVTMDSLCYPIMRSKHSKELTDLYNIPYSVRRGHTHLGLESQNWLGESYFVQMGETIDYIRQQNWAIAADYCPIGVLRDMFLSYSSSYIDTIQAYKQKGLLSDKASERYLYWLQMKKECAESILKNRATNHDGEMKKGISDSLLCYPSYRNFLRSYLSFYNSSKGSLIKETQESYFDLRKTFDQLAADSLPPLSKNVLLRYCVENMGESFSGQDVLAYSQKYLNITSDTVFYDQMITTYNLLADENELWLLDSDGKRTTYNQLVAQCIGKVIYVDFWASWCIPCINELPIVLHAKEIYGDRLTVCAVSLDKNRTLWKKGLEKYKMQHFINLTVLDEDGKADEQIEQLGIAAIPANFLLDKNHQVVGTNLHGKELINTLDRLLKNR